MSMYLIVPVTGYTALWIVGSVFFLAYFKVFGVAMDLQHPAAMLQKIPAFLAIGTVPLCSFASFLVATKAWLRHAGPVTTSQLLWLGLVCLVVTVVLDLLITVVGEKMDIRVYPINLMYLLAWLVILPAVLLAGR